MPESSTLEHVANIIIRRTIAEVQDPELLMEALSRACPFADDPTLYQVWLKALERNGISTEGLRAPDVKVNRQDTDENP
jgi:hypothetical protein